MGALGMLLFVVGIGVAVTGAAKMPEAGTEWPTTWPVFLAGAAVCTVGLIMWHLDRSRQRKAAAKDPHRTTGDPATLLRDLQAPLAQLQAEVNALDTDVLADRVDALLSTYVLPFAEVRRTLIDRFGMEKGAEILVVVAFGERMLNRVWSAAADGHLPEARACLPEATEAFVEAAALLESATAVG